MFCWEPLGSGIYLNATWHTLPIQTTFWTKYLQRHSPMASDPSPARTMSPATQQKLIGNNTDSVLVAEQWTSFFLPLAVLLGESWLTQGVLWGVVREYWVSGPCMKSSDLGLITGTFLTLHVVFHPYLGAWYSSALNSDSVIFHQVCVSMARQPVVLEMLFRAAPAQQGSTNLLIFSLLVPFIHRDGAIGQQARDALLLVMAASASHEAVARYIAENSYFCPVS